MVMVGQAQRLAKPLRWTRAGRIGTALVAAVLVIAVLGVTVYALAGGTREAAGCIEVTFPGTLGGSYLHGCGQKARFYCAHPSVSPAAAEEGALRRACRQQGYRYGLPASRAG